MNRSYRKAVLRRILLSLICTAGLTAAWAADEDRNPSTGTTPPATSGQSTTTGQGVSGSQTAPGTPAAVQAQSAQQFAREAALGSQKEIQMAQIALQKTQNPQVKQFAQRIVTDHTRASQQLMQIAQRKGLTLPATNALASAAGTAASDRRYVRESDSSGQGTSDTSTAQPRTTPGTSTSGATGGNVSGGQPATGQSTTTDQSTTTGHTTPGTTDTSTHSAQHGAGANESQHIQKAQQSIQHLQSVSAAEFDRTFVKHMVEDHAKDVANYEMASRSMQDPELRQFATQTLPVLREHHRMARQLATTFGISTDDIQQPGRTQPLQQPGVNQPGQPNQPSGTTRPSGSGATRPTTQ